MHTDGAGAGGRASARCAVNDPVGKIGIEVVTPGTARKPTGVRGCTQRAICFLMTEISTRQQFFLKTSLTPHINTITSILKMEACKHQ